MCLALTTSRRYGNGWTTGRATDAVDSLLSRRVALRFAVGADTARYDTVVYIASACPGTCTKQFAVFFEGSGSKSASSAVARPIKKKQCSPDATAADAATAARPARPRTGSTAPRARDHTRRRARRATSTWGPGARRIRRRGRRRGGRHRRRRSAGRRPRLFPRTGRSRKDPRTKSFVLHSSSLTTGTAPPA